MQHTPAPADTVYVPVPQIVTVEHNTVQWKTRTQTVTKYLPPEGKVTIDFARYARIEAVRDSLQLALDDALSDTVFSPEQHRLQASLDSTQAILNDPVSFKLIHIQNKGACLRPMLGVGYDGSLDAFVGAKLLYWDRYGLAIGSTSQAAGFALTRRLDFIPYTHNLEGTVFYGFPFKQNGSRMFAGVAVGL